MTQSTIRRKQKEMLTSISLPREKILAYLLSKEPIKFPSLTLQTKHNEPFWTQIKCTRKKRHFFLQRTSFWRSFSAAGIFIGPLVASARCRSSPWSSPCCRARRCWCPSGRRGRTSRPTVKVLLKLDWNTAPELLADHTESKLCSWPLLDKMKIWTSIDPFPLQNFNSALPRNS